jgi:hypothetical protein
MMIWDSGEKNIYSTMLSAAVDNKKNILKIQLLSTAEDWD